LLSYYVNVKAQGVLDRARREKEASWPSAFGRFSEPGLLHPLSLHDGPKHGYAISKDIEQLTHRRLGPGTLYGAIGRLQRDGLIRAHRGNSRRRPYSLTEEGSREARAQLEELHHLALEGRRRLRKALA
jgi:DNA-binding PadR family transcriptional regulator